MGLHAHIHPRNFRYSQAELGPSADLIAKKKEAEPERPQKRGRRGPVKMTEEGRFRSDQFSSVLFCSVLFCSVQLSSVQ